MKFYISVTAIKRLTVAKLKTAGAAKRSTAAGWSRWISSRRALPVVLVLGIVCPFLFVRTAFIMLESATACSSSLDCTGRRFLGGAYESLKLGDELTKALVEAKYSNINEGGTEGSLDSFNQLIKDMASNKQDIKAFVFKTRTMLLKMERHVRYAKRQKSIYWHLASHGIPKSLHCFTLRLAEEYAVNAMARNPLTSPQYVSHLADPSLHHVVILTDNVIAASVVVTSTIENSVSPEKLVFHIVTDKKTYTPMHAWFALNSINKVAVEVKGLHQYDWSEELNSGVTNILKIHRSIWRYYQEHSIAIASSCFSLLNHLRIFIPELFPDLNKVVFMDDDVVIQHDISSLWELDLNGKVLGAVVNCYPGRKYKDYFNFSNPFIASKFDPEGCAWLSGMNVFDLELWRNTNITATYHHWLKQSLDSGLTLWNPGELPPSLIAFENHVHQIDSSWHVAGLGYESREVKKEVLEGAAVIHFSGPAKPWLEIGFQEVRSLWSRHVNMSNKFIGGCRIMG